MPQLLILKGLPASGKSTYAKDLVTKKSSGEGWKRVNRDLLREMIDGGKWSRKNESFICGAELKLAEYFLGLGFNVVVDDTNLSASAQTMWKEFSETHTMPIEEKFFDVSVDEAIKRDLARPISVGSKVIKRMYRDHLMPPVKPYEAPVGVPRAIMVDIDGTLAHMDGRSPYDPTKYHEDKIDPVVKELVNSYAKAGFIVILCSGRDDTYMDVTSKWLLDNGVKFDELFMRPMDKEPDPNNKRKDSIVKLELFEENIAGKYAIEFVLDDRDQVVEMWRDRGLKVLQVAEGDF